MTERPSRYDGGVQNDPLAGYTRKGHEYRGLNDQIHGFERRCVYSSAPGNWCVEHAPDGLTGPVPVYAATADW